MKVFALFALAAPVLSQFCFNSPQVQVCAQEAQAALANCGGNPQCSCNESQHLTSCYQSCQNDPNYFQQISVINAQAAQHCGGGFAGGFGGAFPSAIPGFNRGPSFGSANVNSGMLEATATFRSGGMNSRSFRNSGMSLVPATSILSIAVVSAVLLF
jgi:hypothetical protein